MKDIRRIVQRINQSYYLVYSSTIISTLVGYFVTMNKVQTHDPKSELSYSVSSLVIAYILISIPTALSLFNKKIKSIRAIEDKFLRHNSYIKAASFRLLAVGLGLVMSVITHFWLFSGTSSMSMIYCAGISAIALFFCKPSVNRVANELDIEIDEDEI